MLLRPPIRRPRCWFTMRNSNWCRRPGHAGCHITASGRATRRSICASDELIRSIRLARGETGWKHFYRKVGTRRAQAISKVCFAGAARMNDGRMEEVRIALGSVAPTVLRAVETEKVLRGEKLTSSTVHAAREALAREIAPIDDMRSTANYRLRVAQNLLAEFCEAATA